ncbi:MAG TPA: PRC and DUF2382 domain-containing protein [Actinomycetes bacterium]
MPDIDTIRTWQGRTLLDRDGGRIGTIEAIYLDDRTGQPEWVLVNTGLFGTKSSFAPVAQATPTGNEVRVPYDKQLVKDAPRVDPDQHLSEAEERRLWRHYGLDYDRTTRRRPTGRDTVGRDTSGPTTDDAMTRSEEELRVGTTQRERGRVRLRKYVTTEQVQQAVPVRRERVRVEREPITDANLDAATSGPAISEAEHEVVLREEEPVVEKRVVPRERVRLDKDTVTDQERVAEEVRKEQIDVDDGEGRLGRGERRRRR